MATFVDPRFKLNVFTNQLQKKSEAVVLIDSIKTSDDSASSSPTLTKRIRSGKQSLNQTIHSTFMDCFKEVIGEKSTAYRNTAKKKCSINRNGSFFKY